MNGTRRALGPRRTTLGGRLALAAALALATGCGVKDVIEGGAHDPVTRIDVVDARTETSREREIDPFVVAPMMTPNVPGRIIYEPPTSLAEAAAADTLVRRENTGITSPEAPRGASPDTSGRR